MGRPQSVWVPIRVREPCVRRRCQPPTACRQPAAAQRGSGTVRHSWRTIRVCDDRRVAVGGNPSRRVRRIGWVIQQLSFPLSRRNGDGEKVFARKGGVRMLRHSGGLRRRSVGKRRAVEAGGRCAQVHVHTAMRQRGRLCGRAGDSTSAHGRQPLTFCFYDGSCAGVFCACEWPSCGLYAFFR